MNIPLLLSHDDRDRLFADWGVPALWREVVTAYDPQQAAVEEAFTDTEITVLPAGSGRPPLPGGADHFRATTLTFAIPRDQVPENAAFSTARIVHEGIEYAIRSTNDSTIGGILLAECQKV